jgi:hypothetical protein
LPRNDSFGDALRRLSEAVNLVAFLENRSPESLIVDLRARSTTLIPQVRTENPVFLKNGKF